MVDFRGDKMKGKVGRREVKGDKKLHTDREIPELSLEAAWVFARWVRWGRGVSPERATERKCRDVKQPGLLK
jgi:hypothetical protein